MKLQVVRSLGRVFAAAFRRLKSLEDLPIDVVGRIVALCQRRSTLPTTERPGHLTQRGALGKASHECNIDDGECAGGGSSRSNLQGWRIVLVQSPPKENAYVTHD